MTRGARNQRAYRQRLKERGLWAERQAANNAARRARYASDKEYCEARKAAARGWRLRHPENYLERNRRQYKERSASLEYMERKRAWAKVNDTARRHGLTPSQMADLLKKQNNRCAACGDELLGGRFTHIDHDHGCCSGRLSCGRCVRGLLCHWCNNALGCVHDNPERLRRLIEYLIGHVSKHDLAPDTTVSWGDVA